MLFNSLAFVAFFTVVLAVYHLAPLPWTARKVWLVAAGYLFYASYNPPFIVLLWFTTLLDWFVARGIHAATTQGRRKAMLVASIVVNLGLLGVFKYGRFVVANVAALSALTGSSWHPTVPSLVLPVGISFYTFQSMAYAIDVYRHRIEPAKKFLDYALFVAFFPLLVAGPIVRAERFLPQAARERRATGSQLGWGLALMIFGMFEKMALADAILAPIADRALLHMHVMGPLDAWAGSFAFAGQIFFDFAGYSLCAIGAAMCLGFHVPDNFREPYASVGFSDFWRRWHISLSSWLRDYLYISLGGNRRGPTRTTVNLMLTMLLGGLWHGASWNFVVWGGLHGLFLAAERVLKARLGHVALFSRTAAQVALGALTFLLVCITWVFFRVEGFEHAWLVVKAMFGVVANGRVEHLSDVELREVLTVTAGMLVVHTLMRDRKIEQVVTRTPWWVRSGALAVMLVLIVAMAGGERVFIYFQF
jgi:alginate O-acetyltransferase complex protein AlgI